MHDSIIKTSKFAIWSVAGPNISIGDFELERSVVGLGIPAPAIVPRAYQNSIDRFDIFNTIAFDVTYERAATISKQFRRREQSSDNLMYGEIPLNSMMVIVDAVKSMGCLQEKVLYYDLGSGSGRSTLAAAVCYPFHRCIGIEIMDELFQLSTEIESRYASYTRSGYSDISKGIQFYKGSLLDKSILNWSIGQFVFVNSTCFDQLLMEEISAYSYAMRPGSYIVTLTTPIIEKDKAHPCFVIEQELRLEMSWGMADVFIHRRLDSQLVTI